MTTAADGSKAAKPAPTDTSTNVDPRIERYRKALEDIVAVGVPWRAIEIAQEALKA